MKSPLERAARALCELDNNPPGATMDGKPLWMDYLPEAKAALSAIREPSEAMVQAADASPCWIGHGEDEVIWPVAWAAMIDAALEEG